MKMPIKRRTAQDSVNEGGFLFGEPTTFEKAFPGIEEIKINGTEEGYGVNRGTNPRYANKQNMGEYINCSNPFCQRGGFEIGHEIWDMVREKETKRTKFFICKGDEGSLKGRRIGRRCINSFKAEIEIIYKNK